MDELKALASTIWTRYKTNIQATFLNTPAKKWIQLVIIAGACEYIFS